MPEQTAEKDVQITGKTVLSFHLPTPKWATYIFRTEFVINKALTMYLTGTGAVPADKVKEYLLIMGIIDFIVWFVARGLGVKKTDFENLTTDNP
jgi:hypothetical protein